MNYLSGIGQYVKQQIAIVDESGNNQINNIANACLRPLQWVLAASKPNTVRHFTYEEGHVKSVPSSETSPSTLQVGLGYLTVVPATGAALLLKTVNYGFSQELREHSKQFVAYKRQEKTFKQLIERETTLPKLPDPFTLTPEEFIQFDWGKVNSFLEEAHAFRAEAFIDHPELENFFSRIDKFRQIKPHWQAVRQFFDLQSQTDELCQELTTSSTSPKESYKKLDHLRKEVKALEESMLNINFEFYTKKVIPLSRFISDLEWVIACLELKNLWSNAQNRNEEETLTFRSAITFPDSYSIPESLYERALAVLSIAEDVQKIGEKYSSLYEKFSTVKNGTSSLSGDPRTEQFAQSLSWLDRGFVSCKARLGAVQRSKDWLAAPCKSSELIKLVYQLTKQSNELDFEQLVTYARTACLGTNAARNLLPFCETSLEKISKLRANIFNPLEHRISNRKEKDPLVEFLSEQRKKLDTFESQVAILKMWVDIAIRKELLNHNRLDSESCLNELKGFTDNLAAFREKFTQAKKRLSPWDKFVKFLNSGINKQEKQPPVSPFTHLCSVIEADLSELEYVAAHQVSRLKAEENQKSFSEQKIHLQALGFTEMPKTKEELMAAYKRLARQYHPNSQTGQSNPEMWNKINNAKESLVKEFE